MTNAEEIKEEMTTEAQEVECSNCSEETDCCNAEVIEETEVDPIAELEQKLKDSEEKCLRQYAELDNYKKRMARERAQDAMYRAQTVVTEILPALDNFERALKIEATTDEGKQLQQGMQMVYNQILEALKKEGVEVMDTVGKPFDPNFHQAIQQVSVDGHETGNVVEDYQKGYLLKDRVIRAAMVSVQA